MIEASLASISGRLRARRRRLTIILSFSVALLTSCVAIGIVLLFREARPQLPLNAALTQKAWVALQSGEYDTAINTAGRCISLFRPAADRLEAELNGSPPETEVSDATHAREILARGPLNDVATCYFILGKARLEKHEREPAIRAFQSSTRYPHALAFGPKNTFWSPAQAARALLPGLIAARQ